MYAKKASGKKIAAVLLAVVLLIGGTIGGTLAWLSAQTDAVTNTFTVGDINITLSETIRSETTGSETTGNTYKIVPGGTDDKDPKITVKEGSEKCYVYALVTNTVKVKGAVVATPNIDTTTWYVVATSGDKTLYRYYQVVDASENAVVCPVFSVVAYSDSIEKSDIDTLKNTTIVIDAYAHQSENITDVAVADEAAKAHFQLTTSTPNS